MSLLFLALACGRADCTHYRDADGDGFGETETAQVVCEPGAGFSQVAGDCDDGNATVFDGAPELCDGLDNSCNGEVDDGLSFDTRYVDGDGDGYGAEGSGFQSCKLNGAGEAPVAGDCDDTNNLVAPGAEELCDGVDNDCNELTDDGPGPWYADQDHDGYGDLASESETCLGDGGQVSNALDCDDLDAELSPDAQETCDNRDNDCDGSVDEGYEVNTWYTDSDQDGFGADSTEESTCEEPRSDQTARPGDCDDAHDSVYPGSTEHCYYGLDSDCTSGKDYCATGLDEAYGTLRGGGESRFMGRSVAGVGDINGDGLPDAIVRDDDYGYVLFGPIKGDVGRTSVVVVSSSEASVSAFESVGDLDGDGQGDFVVGVQSDSTQGSNSGAAHVVLGPIVGSFSVEEVSVSVLLGDTENRAGRHVGAVGDMDGDSIPEFAVSGRITGDADYGLVWVYSGSPDAGAQSLSDAPVRVRVDDQFRAVGSGGGDTDGDGLTELLFWSHDNGKSAMLFDGTHAGAVSGTDADNTLNSQDRMDDAVSGGDVNQDGYEDLLFAVDHDAYLLYGPFAGSVDIESEGLRVGMAGRAYYFDGPTIANAGDVNGDGHIDLVQGVWQDADAGERAGAAYVYFGPFTADQRSSWPHGKFVGEASYEEAGTSVAAMGDMDGDGFDDLLIGADFFNSSAASYDGAAYLVLGGF